MLTGSILHLVLGPLADRIGGRTTALIGLSLTLIPLILGGLVIDSYQTVLVIGLMLGIANGELLATVLRLPGGLTVPMVRANWHQAQTPA